mmetsp:Transcript_126125/g.251890  ORF Transcript_126125/g.251890 Transcript_126125/m.251890 type:complete len:479 (+) Transcript_126125:112-1548(+)
MEVATDDSKRDDMSFPRNGEDSAPLRHSREDFVSPRRSSKTAESNCREVFKKVPSYKKAESSNNLAARYHDVVQEQGLSGQDKGEIKRLRTVHWNEKIAPSRNLHDQALNKAWGKDGMQDGSWQVTGEIPRNILGRERETPFNVRRFSLCPKAAETGKQLLHRSRVACVNIKGLKDEVDTSIGQDNFSVSHLGVSGWDVFCVMDGHGPDGHWPSTRSVRTLPLFLRTALRDAGLIEDEIRQAMHHAFGEANLDLESMASKEKVKIFLSGCTALAVLRHPDCDSIWVGHVGDTRAILVAPGHGVLHESRDHKVSIPEERERVQNSGCRVDTLIHPDGSEEARVFLENKGYPGIMMTRSLGDLCVKKNGVIAEPEVVNWPTKDCPPGTRLILATDGAFEFLSSAEVADILFKALDQGKTDQEAVEAILEEAKGAWAEYEDDYCDDITVLMVTLDAPALPPIEVCKEKDCLAGIRTACTIL